MTSGNRHYTNGAAFERRVKARLEEQGWTVFRCAGTERVENDSSQCLM